jgi:hypothetical protein
MKIVWIQTLVVVSPKRISLSDGLDFLFVGTEEEIRKHKQGFGDESEEIDTEALLYMTEEEWQRFDLGTPLFDNVFILSVEETVNA